MNFNGEWAAIVIPLERNGGRTVCVYDETKPEPVYWKFSGGRRDKGRDMNSRETGSRELEEETGLIVPQDELFLLEEVNARDHTRYFFGAYFDAEQLKSLKERGDEGERIAVFTCDELLEAVDFFPSHRKVLEETMTRRKRYAVA